MNPQGFRWIYLPTRLAIYARDSWTCLVCGRAGAWHKGRGKAFVDLRPEALSLDHVLPALFGGTSTPDNLVTTCVGCNARRQDRALVVVWPELVDAFTAAVTSPIDRALGRALCAELDPAFLAREKRCNDRRIRRSLRT